MKKITEEQLLESVKGLKGYLEEMGGGSDSLNEAPTKTVDQLDAEIAKYSKYPQSNAQILARLNKEKQAALAALHADAVATGNAASSATTGAAKPTDIKLPPADAAQNALADANAAAGAPTGKTVDQINAEIAKYSNYPQSNAQILARLNKEKQAALAALHADAIVTGNAATSAPTGAAPAGNTGAAKPTAGQSAPATNSPRQWGKGVLGMGSKGQAVADLQNSLGIPNSGVFDQMTKDAVIAKQKELGVTADGAWGPQTAAKFAGAGAAKPAEPTQAPIVTPVTPTAPAAPTAPAYSPTNPHVPKPDTSKQDAWEKLSPEQQKWLGGADPTDPYILARMRKAVPDAAPVQETVGYSEDQTLARIIQLSR